MEIYKKDTPFGDIYTKDTRLGTLYTNNNKENPFNLMQNTMIYGTNVTLSEKQVDQLIDGKIAKVKLHSVAKDKDYTGNVSIDGVNEKGFAIFKLNFEQTKDKVAAKEDEGKEL